MKVSQLTYRIKANCILKNLSFQLLSHRINWILGPNGAGKSSLLKILCGLTLRYRGTVTRSNYLSAPNRIGFLINQGACFPHLTVSDHMSLLRNRFQIDPQRVEQLLIEWGLENVNRHKVVDLSQGERARYFMVQALVHDPHLIVLDEPENSLDHLGQGLLEEYLKDWRRQSKLVVIASHAFTHLVPWDQLLVLEEGTLKIRSPVEDFKKGPEPVESAFGVVLHKKLSKDGYFPNTI